MQSEQATDISTFPIRTIGLPPLHERLGLAYRHIRRADFGDILALTLDPVQVDRYLGPIEDIVAAVSTGLAHGMFGIETSEGLIGFYVIYPDRRDNACWWLGWFALDPRQQGRGYGRAALAHIMASLRRIDACRRVRLLVDSDNSQAMHIYIQAGFRTVRAHGPSEVMLEAALPGSIPTVIVILIGQMTRAGNASHEGRLRLSAGPHAARMIGVERGPPRLEYPVRRGPDYKQGWQPTIV